MRLDKFIAAATDYSRKDVKKLIKKGAVTLGSGAAPTADMHINEHEETVYLNGEPLKYAEHIYLMMNKPAGYLSATEDAKGQTVIDLLPDEYKRFHPFPAGRLDIDTEGLLILTDDGTYAHRIMSPAKNVYKRYFVRLEKPINADMTAMLEQPMDLGDFVARPARTELTDNPNEIYIKICEGKFHQVKRMVHKCSNEVVYLKRTAIAGLVLDETLDLGSVRELTEAERRAALGE